MINSKQEAYTVIKKIRELITKDDIDSLNKVSEKSKNEYRSLFDQLHMKVNTKDNDGQKNNVLTIAAQTRSKNTWYKRRAAIKFVCLHKFAKFLLSQDRLQKKMNPSDTVERKLAIEKEFINQVIEVKDYLNIYKDLPTGCPIPEDDRKNRVSKRSHMKNLPLSWREEIIQEANVAWRLPILAVAVTGCRPEELRTGVYFEIINNKLICKITSAKVKDGQISIKPPKTADDQSKVKVDYHAGQIFRELHFELGKSKLVDQLAHEITHNGQLIKIKKTASLTSTVRAIAKKLWPQRKHSITAYCFRHQLASDMKSSGMLDDDISTALGHRVSITKSYYGQSQMSGGGHVPSKVDGSHAIKQSMRKPPPTKQAKMKLGN